MYVTWETTPHAEDTEIKGIQLNDYPLFFKWTAFQSKQSDVIDKIKFYSLENESWSKQVIILNCIHVIANIQCNI